MEKLTVEQLATLNSSALLNKQDELREFVCQIGHKHAEAHKKYRDLEKLMPSFLADYVDYYHTTIGMNITAAKNKGLADKGYKEKLKEMNIAEYEAKLLKVEHQAWMESLKGLTSISYLRNSELKLAR